MAIGRKLEHHVRRRTPQRHLSENPMALSNLSLIQAWLSACFVIGCC
jgi:hypothetical protein